MRCTRGRALRRSTQAKSVIRIVLLWLYLQYRCHSQDQDLDLHCSVRSWQKATNTFKCVLAFFFSFNIFPLDPFCLLAFRPSTSLWLFNIWVMSERRVWEKVQNIYSELHLALYGQLRKRLCSGGKLACITNCTFFVKTHKSRRAVTVEVHMHT